MTGASECNLAVRVAASEIDPGRTMEVEHSALMTGCASRLQGMRQMTARHTGGTESTGYCYSV